MPTLDQKISRVKAALYSEMSLLVVTGKDEPAEAIEKFLKEAEDASFVRLYDILAGEVRNGR